MLKKIRTVYQNESVDLQKKVAVLFLLDVVFICILPVLIINEIIFNALMSVILVKVVFLALMIVSVLFIRKLRYSIAANITIIALDVMIISSMFFNEPVNYIEIYKMAFHMLTPMVIAGLISIRRYQVILVAGLNLSASILYDFTRIIPSFSADPGMGTIIHEMILSKTVLIIAAFLVYLIYHINSGIVEEINCRLDEHRRTAEKMTNVMNRLLGSMNIGNNLSRNIERSSVQISTIIKKSEQINSLTGNLNSRMSSSAEVVQSSGEQVNLLQDEIYQQNSALTESSAAVTEMTQSIGNVSNISRAKAEAAAKLIELSGLSRRKLQDTAAHFNEISGSVDKIVEISSIIDSIAAQTNLLAMNAAIEAAHAGESGKGFAVVADEIRKMAEGTAGNAKNISQIIGHVLKSIESTNYAVSETLESVDLINDEIVTVVSAFNEISGSMSELSIGGDEIIRAVTELDRISSSVIDGFTKIKDSQIELRNHITGVEEISAETSGAASDILFHVNEINETNRGIEDLSASLAEGLRSTEELIK